MIPARHFNEANGKAKLCNAEVRRLRADYVPKVFGLRKVAKKWKLPYSTVRGIVMHERRPDFGK